LFGPQVEEQLFTEVGKQYPLLTGYVASARVPGIYRAYQKEDGMADTAQQLENAKIAAAVRTKLRRIHELRQLHW
jgi:hypothetical protein